LNETKKQNRQTEKFARSKEEGPRERKGTKKHTLSESREEGREVAPCATMSSPSHASHVRKLRDSLINLVIENSIGREFIPCDTFNTLMTPSTISRVFQEIVTTNAPQYHPLDYKKWYQTVQEKLPKILAILVWLGKENLILQFLYRSRDDSNLPLNTEDLNSIDHSLLQTRFREKQYCFIAVRFTKGQERHWHEEQILPFLAEKPLKGGEGGFGVVYEVKIHDAYHDMWLFLEGEEVITRYEYCPPPPDTVYLTWKAIARFCPQRTHSRRLQ
jgi:hypothetical protein